MKLNHMIFFGVLCGAAILSGCASDSIAPQDAIEESLIVNVTVPDSPFQPWLLIYSLTYDSVTIPGDSFRYNYYARIAGSRSFSIPAPRNAKAYLYINPNGEGTVKVETVGHGNGKKAPLMPIEETDGAYAFSLHRSATGAIPVPGGRTGAVQATLLGSPEVPCTNYWTLDLQSNSTDGVSLGDLTVTQSVTLTLRRPLTTRTLLAHMPGRLTASIVHPAGTTVSLLVDGEVQPPVHVQEILGECSLVSSATLGEQLGDRW